jgi:hypothetical protein
MRAALTVVVAVLVLATALPLPASAGQQTLPRGYADGAPDSAIGQNCTALVSGQTVLETQVVAGAAAQISARRKGRVGRVFYARARAGIVGTTCSGATVTIEVIPPRGVSLAVSRATPIWFDYPETAAAAVTSNGRDVVRMGRGRFGGTAFNAFFEGRVQPFPLSNGDGPVELHVPLIADRPLGGTRARRPRCRAKGQGQPPCSRRAARDHLQVAVQVGASVTPTLLVSEVGLFTGPARRPR